MYFLWELKFFGFKNVDKMFFRGCIFLCNPSYTIPQFCISKFLMSLVVSNLIPTMVTTCETILHIKVWKCHLVYQGKYNTTNCHHYHGLQLATLIYTIIINLFKFSKSHINEIYIQNHIKIKFAYKIT